MIPADKYIETMTPEWDARGERFQVYHHEEVGGYEAFFNAGALRLWCEQSFLKPRPVIFPYARVEESVAQFDYPLIEVRKHLMERGPKALLVCSDVRKNDVLVDGNHTLYVMYA